MWGSQPDWLAGWLVEEVAVTGAQSAISVRFKFSAYLENNWNSINASFVAAVAEQMEGSGWEGFLDSVSNEAH